MTTSARLRGDGWAVVCLVVVASGCAATDAGVGGDAGAADSGCGWSRCARSGPRCELTGIADRSWLTADFDGQQVEGCEMVPPELREAGSTGRYRTSDGAIGEVTCEGLRPGAATLRLRARVRMLTSDGSTPDDCDCIANWRVALRVLVDGQAAVSIEGTPGDRSADGSCRRGPDIDRSLGVAVGADGRLHARIELTECVRPSTTPCLFLRGTGVEVAQ